MAPLCRKTVNRSTGENNRNRERADRTGQERTMSIENRMGRIAAALLSLLLLLQVLPVLAHAEQTENDEELLTLRYSGFVYPGEYETEIPYSDRYFLQDATRYSHPLARLSMGVSVASFRWDFADDPESYADIARFFRQMGFDRISLSDYDKRPSLFTIASCIASKEIVAGEEPFTLVAVAVCGGNYSAEWASNLTVGTGERHMGFDTAAKLVEDRVTGYLARQKLLGKNIKLWVSGFSRAAAVANIVGADLTDMELCPARDLFVYTFATPRVTSGDTGNYRNIFNIIGKQDPIPRFSPGDWGFARYGRELYTPSQETDSDYFERASRAAVKFKELIGREWWNNPGSNLDLRLLYDHFIDAFANQEDYVQVMQEPLASLVENKSLPNLIRQFGRILSNPDSSGERNRAVRAFLKYLLGMAAGDAIELGEQSVMWQTGALASGNAVHEHCLEVYLAWLLSSEDPAEIYTESKDWLRIFLVGRGEFLVTDRSSGELVCTWIPIEDSLAVMSDALPGIRAAEDMENYEFYCASDEETAEQVLLLPCDRDYDLWFVPRGDQTISGRAAWFPSFLEKDVFFRELTASASEGKVIHLLNVGALTAELSNTGDHEKSPASPKEEAELLQFKEGKALGDRVLLAALLAAVLFVCLLVLLLWLLIRGVLRRGRAARAVRTGGPV